jgi:23S rRNA pseudouridine2605 synthase
MAEYIMRIAKYLASAGLGSRRKSEELILSGKVSVNGQIIDSPAISIDPDTDKVEYNGKVIQATHKVYFLLYKPTGFTSTMSDSHAKRLITELVPDKPPVWPVGRLDRETSGLIILTNDGDLTQKLTHPSFVKSKTYIATVDKPLSDKQIAELASGITLEDGSVKPDRLKSLGSGCYEITIHEGRNRLVRRMFEYFDRQVMSLERTKISFLTLKGLKAGDYRILKPDEVERLKNA